MPDLRNRSLSAKKVVKTVLHVTESEPTGPLLVIESSRNEPRKIDLSAYTAHLAIGPL